MCYIVLGPYNRVLFAKQSTTITPYYYPNRVRQFCLNRSTSTSIRPLTPDHPENGFINTSEYPENRLMNFPLTWLSLLRCVMPWNPFHEHTNKTEYDN